MAPPPARVTPAESAEWRIQRSADDQLLLDGQVLPCHVARDGNYVYQLRINGHTYDILLLGANDAGTELRLRVNGKACTVTLPDLAADYKALIGLDKASTRTAADLKAPMPGLVRAVRVQAGDTVQKGDPLVVLEAMKMENILKAAGPATVAEVRVQEGAAVEKGALLVKFA